ncbi:ATP-binding protein [Methyloligella sp. 2.7D]|uniref:ATP-binding protein n=1 Tax=unclassified Methyloligella TaxID=2625955 RepID=UPI00157BD5A1|nr:ATP-binding protein [Methyloligella sp. GL2]QKP78742.1 HAMP domain-containing protein [Methyloligella sp. GL2]
MALLPEQTVSKRGRIVLLARLRAFLRNQMPKGLYARALIIIITPMVLLQSVLTFVFLERHWELVTKRLSTATVQSISALVDVYDSYPQDANYDTLTRIADEALGMRVQIVPDSDLPAARSKPFFDLLDRTLSDEMRRRIGLPFWIDTVGQSNFVDIRIKLEDGAVMHVLARRSQTYASNSQIFLFWMLGTSLVLLTVAILFLRNQIKPVVRLSEAAESFGKGRPVPPDFRPRGAREVRQAAVAFLEMRDRIERHVEQRTTMLAGVSHDLRTILTRFRLELALLKESPEVNAMREDVDEMQAMLEDYLAFAKGDSGEETSTTNVGDLLAEVRQNALAAPQNAGKTVNLKLPSKKLTVPLKRNAFKRAVGNLVNNAARYAETIQITARKRDGSLYILVEDDGPGIPEEEREQVFRPFYRVDDARNQDSGSTGTGLGLAIARDIARLHGGDIKLDDSKLGGLKVEIRVPV